MTPTIYLACEPIYKPPGLLGNVLVYQFDAKSLRSLLALCQRTVAAFAPTTEFYRAFFWADSGDWLADVALPAGVEFNDDWVELAVGCEAMAAEIAQKSVRAEGWSLGIGSEDVLWHFRERHGDDELETPLLSYAKLESLLQRLEASEEASSPSEIAAHGVVPEAMERNLWNIARHYQQALDMSDPDHEDFADSGSDVVEHLWLITDLVRDTLANEPVDETDQPAA